MSNILENDLYREDYPKIERTNSMEQFNLPISNRDMPNSLTKTQESDTKDFIYVSNMVQPSKSINTTANHFGSDQFVNLNNYPDVQHTTLTSYANRYADADPDLQQKSMLSSDIKYHPKGESKSIETALLKHRIQSHYQKGSSGAQSITYQPHDLDNVGERFLKKRTSKAKKLIQKKS